MELGAILRACRVRAKLSQEKLAEKMCVSRSVISKIEGDKQSADFNTVLTWVEATGAKEVMVAFLYGMDGLTMIQNILGMM